MALTRTQQQLRDRLYAELSVLLAPLELDLVEVELTPVGRSQRVGLVIDRPEGHGPVRIEDCARASRAVSARLDELDPFDSEYDLEVYSPGTERKLRDLNDVVRFVGNTARVQVVGASSRLDDGAKEAIAGVVMGVEATAEGQPGFRLRVGKKSSSDRVLAWQDVVAARLALTPAEWDALGKKLLAEQTARQVTGLEAPAGDDADDLADDDNLIDDNVVDDDLLDDDEPNAL